jgi:hypothetical protein
MREKEKKVAKKKKTVFLQDCLGDDMAISTHYSHGFSNRFRCHECLLNIDTTFSFLMLIIIVE